MPVYSLEEIVKQIATKQVSATEVTAAMLKRIDETSALNALTYVDREGAMAQAKNVDQRIAKGERVGSLAGVPIVIKDNICVKGLPTTCASEMLRNFVPPYDATVIKKLKAADAVLIAKANMDEFAMGSSSETSCFGPVHHPIDFDRVSGGSSGGSAVSVAAGQCYASLGSDTGGSIRQPASFCGVVGIKPTYGTVSRYGVVAYASSLDQVGTFGRSVSDAAAVLDVISGHDAKESTSLQIEKRNCYPMARDGLKGKRIGYVRQFFDQLKDADVKATMQDAFKRMTAQGAELVEVSMPSLDYAIAAYYIIASAEAASNLARYDGVKYGYRAKKFEDVVDLYYKTRSEAFGAEVKRRIMLGNFVLSSGYFDAYYLKALKTQTLIRQEFSRVFQSCDFIVSPTAPTPAFRIGELTDDPMAMYLSDVYTVPVNIAGIPAVSVPAGVSQSGLPIGMQLMGDRLSEDKLLAAAMAFEEALA